MLYELRWKSMIYNFQVTIAVCLILTGDGESKKSKRKKKKPIVLKVS